MPRRGRVRLRPSVLGRLPSVQCCGAAAGREESHKPPRQGQPCAARRAAARRQVKPAADALGLYIHLPWCERKCPYCDFNSHEREHLPEDDYVTALLADLAGEAATVTGRAVETVFIGGGTLSLFSAAAIERLLQGIGERVALAPDAEITLEANPGSAEAAKFAAFRRAGVNRLSLGIQSFDDAALVHLGRVHNRAQA